MIIPCDIIGLKNTSRNQSDSQTISLQQVKTSQYIDLSNKVEAREILHSLDKGKGEEKQTLEDQSMI